MRKQLAAKFRNWALLSEASFLRRREFSFLETQKYRLNEGHLTYFTIGAIGLLIILQLCLVFIRQINWDEFYFLSRIYEYQSGTLTAPLQTFYVHLFGWVPRLADNEIDQIVYARLVMLAFHIGTLSLIYYAARHFVSRNAALLGVLSYTACVYVFLHAAAFRADPVATFLLMSSITILLVSRLTWFHVLAAGAAVAIAGLMTIKSIIYVPIIFAVAILRLLEKKDRRSLLSALSVGVTASFVIFAVLYFMQVRGLVTSEHTDIFKSASASFEKVFGASVFFPGRRYFVTALAVSPLTFAAIGVAIVLCMRQAIVGKAGTRFRGLVLLIFAFPLATLFFYRNSFPYYYVFALAPAGVLSAIAFDRIGWVITKLLCAIALTGLAVFQFGQGLSPGQSIQRTTLNTIHAIFPKPVAYIDRCSMVSSFPKVGFFMSTWGMEGYRAAGHHALLDAITRGGPQFVVANSPILEEALVPGSVAIPNRYRLLEADASALRDNYIHHWGAIWVAGKIIEKLGADHVRSFSILIPGSYTIELQAAVAIDGNTGAAGEVITLTKGIHTIRGSQSVQTVTLRWGNHLLRPTVPAPQGAIFSGF